MPADKSLTLAAEPKTAYVQPIEVGDAMPPMPLFLTADYYVNVPLEATYQAAYAGEPRFYRSLLEQ